VETVEVILIDMPRMLREILRPAVREAGMTIRAEHATVAEALNAIATAAGADGVRLAVLGADDQLDEHGTASVRSRLPLARVVAVASDGGGAVLHLPGQRAVRLLDSSAPAVAIALRGDG
jgi:hypothetical protein